MSTRKNRAFELRLALLEKGTPASDGGGGVGGGRRSLSGSVAGGGRWSRLSSSGGRDSVFSSRHGSAQSSSLSGARRRPHRLPELGESVSSLSEELAPVKVTNLQFGQNINEPLPPITPVDELENSYNNQRNRRIYPSVPPLDVLLEQEKRLREDLHSERCQNDLGQEVISLQELGDLSIQKNYHNQDHVHILHSAAIYNVALLKSSDDDQKIRIRSRLLEAERQLLQNSSKCTSVVIDKYLALDTGARDNRKLSQIRQEVRERIQNIETALQLECKETAVPNEETVRHFAHQMTEIGQCVQKASLDLLSHMVTTCKAILGEPPCKYALLSVGELAAFRGNPFDMPLEFIVLTGNDIRHADLSYFDKLFNYMHLKILNLGESPLSVAGVKTFLDDENECINCFYDEKPLAGVYLDFRPFSTRISPLMTEQGDGFRRLSGDDEALFIGPPWQIASLVRRENIERVGYEICDKLMNFVMIDGDKSIVEEYAEEIECILREEQLELTYRVSYTCDWLTSRLHTSEPFAVRNNGLSALHMHQLRPELELIHDILGAMKIHNEIPSGNAKNIIGEMAKNSLVTDEDAESLALCWAISYYFELKEKMPCHEDTILEESGKIENLGYTSNQYTFTDWMVINYYQTLVPCWTCLFERAKSYKKLSLEGCTLSNANYKVKALSLQRLDEHNVAIQLLRNELEEVRNIPDQSLSAILSHDIYTLIGLLSLVKGDLKESRTSWNRAMDYKEIITDTGAQSRAFLLTWHNFGLLQLYKGKLDKALEQLTECVSMSHQILKEYQIEKDDFDAGIYENLGRTQSLLGMFDGALKSFDIAIRLRASAKINIENYEALRYIYYKMGYLNYHLAMWPQALSHLFESLRYHGKLKLTDFPDIWDAMLLRDVSNTYKMMGKLTLASNYRLQMGKICQRLYTSLDPDSTQARHYKEYMERRPVEYVVMLFELGSCLLCAKEYHKSIEVFDKLEEHLAQLNHNQIKCFIDVDLAHVSSVKGEALYEMSNSEEAEASFRTSLDMFNKTYSEKSMPTYLIAMCHKGLGATLLQTESYEEATKHLDIACEYFRFTYGKNEVYPAMCDILNMNAVAKRGMGDFVGCRTALQEWLCLEEKLVGATHVRVARCITELGKTYSMEGLYESAMNSFEQAMNIYRKVDLGCDRYLEEIPRLYIYRARCHIALGRIPQAERCWERAASKGKAILLRHPSKLRSFNELLSERANFYRHIDRPDEATNIRREIIEQLKEIGRSDNDPEILAVYFAIGKDYSASGRTEEAICAIRHAIDQKRSNYDQLKGEEANLDIASWLSELSKVYAKAGEQEKSSECYLECLYLKKKYLGQDAVDENVITSLQTIADLHEKRGEFRQAIALLKQSFAKSIQSQGEENQPHMINTVERLASAYQQVGEHSSALRYWQDALELREGSESEEFYNEILADIHRNCGQCLDGLKSHERAIEHYHKSLQLLKMCEDLSGKDIRIALTIGDIGKALNNLGRSQEAVDHLVTSVSSLRSLGYESDCQEQLASILLYLGLAHDTCGQIAEAKECYLNSLALKRELNKSSASSERNNVLKALGRLCYTSSQYKEGISYLEEALNDLQSSLTKDEASLEVASVLEEIGDGYAQIGEKGTALKRTTEALQMLRRHFGHKRPCLQIARCLSALASICFKAERNEDTIAYAKQAIRMYVAILPENSDHPELVVLNTILGDCYWGMKQYQESLSFYKKAAQISLYLHNGDAMHADVVEVMGKLQEAQKKFGVST